MEYVFSKFCAASVILTLYDSTLRGVIFGKRPVLMVHQFV